MGRGGRAAAAVAGMVCAIGLVGCAPMAEGESCISWVFFDTPGDAAEEATVVVRATVADDAGAVSLWGTRANVWRLDVEEVLAGSMRGVVAGEELEVASSPRTCDASGTYPDGDPFDAADEVIVLIEDDTEADVVRTLTPFDGVVAPSPDGGLPVVWPQGHHDL